MKLERGVAINVDAKAAGILESGIPMRIPMNGLFLNFIKNPVKDLPAHRQ